jgi:hypothetical protein
MNWSSTWSFVSETRLQRELEARAGTEMAEGSTLSAD